MRCPNSKCKGTKLQTKRTFEHGSSTKREKYCPKCKQRHISIELFESDYNKIIQEFQTTISELKTSNAAADRKYLGLVGAIRVVTSATIPENGNGKKKSKKSSRAQECRMCGSTNEDVSVDGGYWVEEDLCSNCAPAPQTRRK